MTLSLFDDDTGNAIDLSGRTLAAPGDFTGANWIVQIGTIVTASASARSAPTGRSCPCHRLSVNCRSPV
ncbi:hypothetical protein ACRAWF_45665 [Streptomyces sp. L7]